MSNGRPPEIPSDTDRLFSEHGSAPAEFRFDDAVARVFPDMLRRSIPGYSALLQLIGVLSSRIVKDETVVYDLGCSLGAVSLSIRHALGARPVRIIAIDNSDAMVKRAREILSADRGLCPVDVRTGDITTMKYERCSLIVLNFTLQFAPPGERARLLKTLADSLLPGGALVLSEKTATSEDGVEELYRDVHDAFRQSNGYSSTEISRKREALERVLVPETAERYAAMLEGAGLFPLEWFRCLQFVSWVARKEG